MKLYNLLNNLIMMDTDHIIVKDNELNIIEEGSYFSVLGYAVEHNEPVEGIGCYDGILTIILK